MSDLILCANGGRFGGDRALRESEKGRFLYLECSLERLKQPAGAGHRLEQPVVEYHI